MSKTFKPNKIIIQTPICPYCGKHSIWTDNAAVYGKRFGRSYMCYYCRDCDAYVGCHNNSRKPLGTLANKELRTIRMDAHSLFDPLWKSGRMTRGQAYKLLAEEFHTEVHIGESGMEQCQKIIDFLKNYPSNLP